MALSNDITLNPGTYGGTAGDKIYNLLPPQKDGSTVRRVPATAFTTPETLSVNHREVKEGGYVVDQHLVRVDEVVIDPVQGSRTISVWQVIKVPRGTSVITTAQVKSVIGRCIHAVLTAGHTDKILAGES